jgi:hypothetical protein
MLSTYDTVALVIAGAAAVVFGSIAFSAFSIRRRMSGNLYRQQGLGIGLVTVLFGGFTVLLTLSSIFPAPDFVLTIISTWLVFWSVFYWIDSSIRAARFTDPLLRDTFHWKRLRVVLWAYDVGGPLGILGVFIWGSATGGSPSTPISPALSGLLFGTLFAPIVIALFSGFVVFPIVARRSADRNLRMHLEWFAVYASTILLLFVVSLFNSSSSYYLVQGLVSTIASYTLYRSTRSLVPIYRFPGDRT